MVIKYTLPLFLALLSQPIFAAGPFYDEAEDTYQYREDDVVIWQEQSIEFPALPKDENLLPFDIGAPERRFNYLIDRSSLSVGKDGIIRFSLVIESNSGVKNSSYEGIRCSTKEYKVYAYGLKNQFKAVRKPAWRRILPQNLYHLALYRDYLCDSLGAVIQPLSSEQVIKNILTQQRHQEY